MFRWCFGPLKVYFHSQIFLQLGLQWHGPLIPSVWRSLSCVSERDRNNVDALAIKVMKRASLRICEIFGFKISMSSILTLQLGSC